MNTFLRGMSYITITLLLITTTGAISARKHFLGPPLPPQLIIQEHPSPVRMMADLGIGRPLLIAATGLGAAIFLVSLPFTYLAGNVRSASHTLVEVPADAAFKRCLGCLSFSNPPPDHTDPRYR